MRESHFEKRRAASASNFRQTFWIVYWKDLISNWIFHQIINLNLCWTSYTVFVQVKKQQVVSDMPGGGKRWWSMGDEWRSQQSADEWGTVLVADGYRGEASRWWGHGGQRVKYRDLLLDTVHVCCVDAEMILTLPYLSHHNNSTVILLACSFT